MKKNRIFFKIKIFLILSIFNLISVGNSDLLYKDNSKETHGIKELNLVDELNSDLRPVNNQDSITQDQNYTVSDSCINELEDSDDIFAQASLDGLPEPEFKEHSQIYILIQKYGIKVLNYLLNFKEWLSEQLICKKGNLNLFKSP